VSPHKDRVQSSGPERSPASVFHRMAIKLLRFPLFYKILLANLGILVLGAGSGILLVHYISPAISASTVFIISGVVAFAVLAIGSFVHAYLIRAALSPLRTLEETARRVEAGDPAARAEESVLADESMAGLVRVFNAMLDTLGALRQQERARSAQALKAEEVERLRTSRELYDHLAQTLAGVLLRLRVITSGHAPADDDTLEEVRTEVRAALERARHVARRLHPPELDDLGLEAAVEAYARTLDETSNLTVTVDVSRPIPTLGAEVCLAAFRIVQEALQNSARHSGATRASVSLSTVDDELTVEIVDDGRGFDAAEAIADRDGLGLSSMLDRAAHRGGSLTVDSRPGAGTRVCLSMPIARTNPQPPASRATPSGLQDNFVRIAAVL
jgi:two-component system sensor histidine kinase UhpB